MDWHAGMSQTYELIKIDGSTWLETEKVQTLSECSITYEDEGLRYSVTASVDEELDPGYYRIYLIAEQGDDKQRVALATFLSEIDTWEGDGKRITYKIEGYSPLKELEDTMPAIGWAAVGNVVEIVSDIVDNYCRAPLSAEATDVTVSDWVAEEDETWLDVIEALLALADMHLEVDSTGRVLLKADADNTLLSAAYTFSDDNSELQSILMPDVSIDTDYSSTPNRCEVVYSDDDVSYIGIAENNDENSAVSIPNRGRTVLYRETSPDVSSDTVSQSVINALAVSLLTEQTAQTVTQTYSHGYTPDVQIGTCVRLDYQAMSYSQKAVVTKQVLDCQTGLTVEETAEYTISSATIENVDE